MLLTHGHSDHIGFAERAHGRASPCGCTRLMRPSRRSEVPNPAKGFGPIKLRPLLGFLLFSARHGLMRIPKIQEVGTFGDGATLDVPGAPRVIHVPGHTPGSAAALRGS